MERSPGNEATTAAAHIMMVVGWRIATKHDVLNILDKAGSLARPPSIKQDRSREDRYGIPFYSRRGGVSWVLALTRKRSKYAIQKSSSVVCYMEKWLMSPLSTNVNQVSDEVSDNNETLSQSVAADDNK